MENQDREGCLWCLDTAYIMGNCLVLEEFFMFSFFDLVE